MPVSAEIIDIETGEITELGADEFAKLGPLIEEFIRSNGEMGGDTRELVGFLLEILPGTGELISAADAIDAFTIAVSAAIDGDTDRALDNLLRGAISTLGAVPLLGSGVRLTKGVIKLLPGLRSLVRRTRGLDDVDDAVDAGRAVTPNTTPGTGVGDVAGSAGEPIIRPHEQRILSATGRNLVSSDDGQQTGGGTTATIPLQPAASLEEATQQFGQALQSLGQVQGGSRDVIDQLNQLRIGVTDEKSLAFFEGQRIAQLFVGLNPDTQEFADLLISEQLAGRSLTNNLEAQILEGFNNRFRQINQRKVWLHYRDDLGIASSREAILAFVRLARGGQFVPPPGRSPRLVLDTLDALDNQQLHAATLASGKELNLDLDGFKRIIWLDGVAHAFNSHGPNKEKVTE